MSAQKTALNKYARLEALGLWRERAEDQRREVIVSLGTGSLTLASAAGDALGHWALAAIERLNPGKRPALFTPDPESDEVLELADPTMIEAIETIRKAIARTRPRPGRLRLALTLAALVTLGLGGWFWLPEALTRQTARLLPEASRGEIGSAMLAEMSDLAGRPCTSPAGSRALSLIAARTFGTNHAPGIVVLPDLIPDTIALPGGHMVISSDLVEDHASPEVLAGHLLAERVRGDREDPLLAFLTEAGFGVTLRLLTSGNAPTDAIHAHAARLLSSPTAPVPDIDLLRLFAETEISSQPYAFARDVSGETVLTLIEADPMNGTIPVAVLRDADWVALQEICTG